MTQTPDITRPDPSVIEKLKGIGAATAAAELHRLGIRNTHLEGLRPWTPGKSIVGPALTLEFMPIREDVYEDSEYKDPESQLHRHAMYHAQDGDVIVVDARGKMDSGVFGDMMMTYFKGRGGQGVIIDGCLRDWVNIQKLDIGCWIRGVTPNYHTQRDIFPYAVNVPVACGGCYVAPGDIIIADDDGAVVVPIGMVDKLLGRAKGHVEWEVFTRMKLSQGGDLRKYYPMREGTEAWDEYLEWKAAQGR
jgi:regulator of RNase E activity RraA